MNRLLLKPEGHLAKMQIVQMLDAVCQAIEPTETQYSDATGRYQTIGDFLAEKGSPLHCYGPVVYPQGSMRIKAAIRPVNGKEFDVDLVCEFRKMPQQDPKVVKRLVWDRFHNSERYRTMAAEKNRCVQIKYEGQFHMDVMPCIPGDDGWAMVGGVWVPDKKLDDWKASNPAGFARFVETAAAKIPRQQVLFANRAEAKSADVEPLEVEDTFTKPPLIRIIQVLKRHRDEYFRNNHDDAPISVIITTLATHSYDRAVTHNTYSSVYDLVLDVVEGMLDFVRIDSSTTEYCIPNPSHPEENFAERWNENPMLADWFFAWRSKVGTDLRLLAQQEEGVDKVGKLMESAFGSTAANQAVRSLSASVRDKTANRLVGVTSTGLIVPEGLYQDRVEESTSH